MPAHQPALKVQFPIVYKPLDDPYRYKVMWGGRAAARSWTIARKLLIRGTQKKLLILCTRELQKSIKDSVHRLLKNQIALLGLGNFYSATNSAIVGSNGTEFIFLGTRHNPDEIRSTEGIDICWIEEGHALTENGWDVIDPTIRKDGSEIWVSYNTRFKFDYIHKNFVVDRQPPDSWVKKTSYRDNPFLTDVLKKQLATMKEKNYEKYLNIWEGELKQLAQGAIFGQQVTNLKQARPTRLTKIPIQKNCEVDTFWDLGKSEANQTAVWFMQRVGMEYRFIDYFEAELQEIEYYVKVVKKLDYNYGTHYFPHDADHDRLGMVKNIFQQFKEAGVKPAKIVPRIKLKTTAIELGRSIMSRCWFHRDTDTDYDLTQCDGYLPDMSECNIEDNMRTRALRAERGFDTLSNYRYRYIDKDDVYDIKPHHDWASNGADSYMQFAQMAPKLGYTDRSGNNSGSFEPEYAGDY